MKKHLWIIGILILTAPFTFIMPINAQEGDTVLQLAVPFLMQDIFQTVTEQYEAENPGIRVELVPYQGIGMSVADSDEPEEYLDNLEAYFSSADILLVDSGLTPEATRAGYILDLSPLTQSDLTYNAAEFHPTLLRSFQWDGGQWALPISTSFTIVSYIPEAFDAVGLAYPSASWTLDDLANAAQRLAQYDADGSMVVPGLSVLGLDSGSTLSALFLSLLGNSVYDDTTFPNDPDFSNPLLETYLDTWLQMIDDGLLSAPAGVNPADVPLVVSGGGLFLGATVGFGAGGQQAATQRSTALLPGGRAGLSVNGYAVSSGTQHPQAAYDFVNYLVKNPNAVAVSLGTVPAVRELDPVDTTASTQGGFGGVQGLLANLLAVPAELEPLVEDALQFGIPLAEQRFSEGINTALNLMQNDGYDARTALDEAQNQITERLAAADERATTSRIAVAQPRSTVQLAAGEIMLNFGILGGGGGVVVVGRGGGSAQFTQQAEWQTAIDTFTATDPQVAIINLETATQLQLSDLAESYDCFYVGANLVSFGDLDHLLNLDPLLDIDPTFSPNDFISGVFDQVRVNNQTWALPVQISPLVLRYNYDVYSMAGVTPPQGSWTVSDFEDTIRQIAFVIEEDQSPLVLNASSQSALLTLIAAYGGLPFDTRGDSPIVNFTDPTTMDAIRQVLDLARDGYISFPTGSTVLFGIGPGGGAGAALPQVNPIYSNVLSAFGFGGFGGGNTGAQNTDGVVTFPRGAQFNVVPVDLGTAYISASTQHAEACYRFITYLTQTTDLFQSMPARRSVINSPQFAASRGQQNVTLFNALADLMEEPTTIVMPTNLTIGTFGMTNWLFEVFNRYVDGEVIDLEADLRQAEQRTEDYLDCLAAIPPLDLAEGDFLSYFQQINQCQISVSAG